MTHHQLGERRGVRAAMSLACSPLFAFLLGSPLELANAGEFDRSTLPAAAAGPAQCDGRDEGQGVLKDSGDCKRINGYIAAGARFGTDEQISGRPSPFGSLDAPEFVGSLRPSGAAVINAPAGLERFFSSPGPDDHAR
jgi:hypothetical protein